MAKEWAKGFYNSKAWRECREAYAKSRGYLCERCDCNIGDIVHHKIYLTEKNISNPNVSLNWDNLELLCQSCHNAEHQRKNKRRYIIGELGEIRIVGDPPY